MDSNILDELLNRIKTLETQNNELKVKNSEILVKTQNLNKEQIEEEINNLLNNIKDDNSFKIEKKQILDNLKEITISYIPYEQINQLWIMGDFTEWEPKMMNKNKDIFSYNVILLKGYKYYFCFNERDKMNIDMNNDYENNPKNNQINNYIDLSLDNNIFDYKLLGKQLVEAKHNYTKARWENEAEVEHIENVIKNTSSLNQMLDKLNRIKEEERSKINKFYENKLNKIKNLDISTFVVLGDTLKGRILEKDNLLYYVNNLDVAENEIRVIRLYDSNGLKVNINKYIQRGNLIKIKMKLLSETDFKIHTLGDSENILNKFNSDNSVIKIFFTMKDTVAIRPEGYTYLKVGEKKFTFEKAIPENIKLEEYDIINDSNVVLEVINKKDNLSVLFSSEQIKDEFDSLPISLNIYYSYYRKTLNILHIHSLNENINIDKGFEVIHIDRSESIEKYKEFNENDNLKIIFKSYRLNKIFFKDNNNVVQLRCNEFNYKLERIVKINSENSYLNGYYAKIKKIPVQLLAHIPNQDSEMIDEKDSHNDYDQLDLCLKNPLDYLIGLIDVMVCFDNSMNCIDQVLASFPACMLEHIPSKVEMVLEEKYIKDNSKRNAPEIIQINNMLEEFRKYNIELHNIDSIRNLPLDQIRKLIIILDEFKNLQPGLYTYIENNEMWEYIEKLSFIDSMINNVLPILYDLNKIN